MENTRLEDVIQRNTGLTSIQTNPFFFRPEVSGTVVLDNAWHPAAGVTVRLVDAGGAVAATATTDTAGRYHIGVADGLRTGAYKVQVLKADGTVVAGPTIQVTGGDTRVTADVSLASPPPAGTPPHPPRPAAPQPRGAAPSGATRLAPPAGFEFELLGTDVTRRR